jgi:acetyl-CoA carboxylase carboxyl transferase subunit beta
MRPPPAPVVVGDEWLRCEGCSELLYRKRWVRNDKVCHLCHYHGRLTARERIAILVDQGSFDELSASFESTDPLGFVDSVPYPERLTRAKEVTGENEAVVCGTATVDGRPLVLAVMTFDFLGGSLGIGAGELVTLAAELALARRLPLLLVPASGGARMQEGVFSLLQMAKTSQAIGQLHEAGLLAVSLITDPSYGGVAASFATQADVIIAEPAARLGFAGPRVIRQTTGQTLPAGFQTAEFLLRHGLVDLVVERARLREVLGRVLEVADEAPTPIAAGQPPAAAEPADAAAETADAADPWAVVQQARHKDRPTARDYLDRVCDWFVELHGDRQGADSPTLVGGLARLGNRCAVVVGIQKGHSTRELVGTNFGMAGPAGYRKAMRLYGLAEKLRLPLVTLVDTPGADPGVDSEREGQAHAIAASILRLSGLRTPIVSVITGEGGSGGALALATADRTYLLAGSVYSVISPEGCAAILWDARSAAKAAAALQLTAADLIGHGLIDGVIPEPPGGAHTDVDASASAVRRTIDAALDELAGLSPAAVVEQRRDRLRSVGTAQLVPRPAGPASDRVAGPPAAGTGRPGPAAEAAGPTGRVPAVSAATGGS